MRIRSIPHTPMSSIDILHRHTKDLQQAREAVEDVARKLAERFDFAYRWDGDTLNFSRSGVDGRIRLAPEQLHVSAKLGFMLSMLQRPIENEIRRVLEEKFR